MVVEEKVIETDNLSKYYITIYGVVKALDNITVTIKKGITLLIGPNGSGKSTFIKLIMGASRPTKGKIKVFNKNLNEKTKKRLRFHVGPEYYPKNVYVWRIIDYASKIYGASQQEVRETIKKFELEDMLNMKFGALSSGMSQRVSMAVSFIGEPEYIIFDEPFVNLDPYWMNVFVKEINAHGNALVVSHMMDIVNMIEYGRLLFINNGKLLYDSFGKLRELEVRTMFYKGGVKPGT